MAKPQLTKERIRAAYIVAIVADVIQIPITAMESTLLGAAVGEAAACVLDVVVVAIMTKLLGFHWMFLPTFAVETIPFVSVLPSWVGCVAFVTWQRKKEESHSPPPQPFIRGKRP
jgi:hypothetical protein